MRRHLHTLLACLGLFVASISPAEAGESAEPSETAPEMSASETFRSQHAVVTELTRARADRTKIEAAVDVLLDYHSLTVQALGGAKRSADRCADRCEELEHLLARLIRDNYMRRVRTDRDHTVRFLGEETRGKSVRVKTEVEYSKEGRPVIVEVTYVMHASAGRWQVRDIITDGVSLARNYKYEFHKILNKDGIDGLIARIESKVSLVANN